MKVFYVCMFTRGTKLHKGLSKYLLRQKPDKTISMLWVYQIKLSAEHAGMHKDVEALV